MARNATPASTTDTNSTSTSIRKSVPAIDVTGPDKLKEQVHASVFRELPWHLGELEFFKDCRITLYQEYRVVLITADGLGVDMDHRQNDVNYFQADSQDIAYSDAEVEYISRRKARQYAEWGKVSLFKAVWTDLVEAVAELKQGSDLLYP